MRLRWKSSHWRADGRPKVTYLTEAGALAAAERTRRSVEVYRCAECGGWHIGHARQAAQCATPTSEDA